MFRVYMHVHMFVVICTNSLKLYSCWHSDRHVGLSGSMKRCDKFGVQDSEQQVRLTERHEFHNLSLRETIALWSANYIGYMETIPALTTRISSAINSRWNRGWLQRTCFAQSMVISGSHGGHFPCIIVCRWQLLLINVVRPTRTLILE